MSSTAKAKFHLGKVWKLKGAKQMAVSAFREALEQNPTYVEARIALADVLLDEGKITEALEQYDLALDIEPDHPQLKFRRRYLRTLSGDKPDSASTLVNLEYEDRPNGKLCLKQQKRFSCHRGGWNAAIDTLRELNNRNGVLFDSFIEDNFAWKHWKEGVREPNVLKRLMHEGGFEALATSEEKGITPYRRPWVGVLHNPHNMPNWFHYQESPQSIFAKDIWKRSAEHCLGLFCLSEYQAVWLRTQVDCPISTLIHPAQIPDAQFDFSRFERNPSKQVVQVGWWLRKLNSIYQLPISTANPMGYQKIRLVPRFFDDADRYLKELIAKEEETFGIKAAQQFMENTREVQHLSNAEYDALLAENIVFVELHDAGANNTVVECIARSTPIFVNKLPSVVEYLGEDYPLFYESLEEAAEKAMDIELVESAHLYLKSCPTRKKLSFDYFKESVEASEIYKSLPSTS